MTYGGEYQEILTSTVCGIHFVSLGEHQLVLVVFPGIHLHKSL